MLNKDEKDITKIVLTGGPCAGKTTIFKKIADYLIDKGYYVITIPETATELIKSRILPSSNREHTLMFQNIVLQQQYIKERVAEEYAKAISKNSKVIILYDRGILDNRAYLESQEDFEFILNNNNIEELSMLNKYDLVIDLISTSVYKKDSYKLDGVRSESIEEAALLDRETSMAWIHHNNLKVVKPTENIDDKVNKVFNIVDNFLNNNECENKKLYELDNSSDLSIYNGDNSKKLDIYYIYLDNGMIITKKNYRKSSILIYNGQKITSDQFTDLIYLNKVLHVDSIKVICYIDDGNIYKIISDNKQLYLECDDQALLKLPDNLILSKNKTLVKKKKSGNI